MANQNRRNRQVRLSILNSAVAWLGTFDVQSQGEIKFPSMFGYSKNPEQPDIHAFRSVLQQVYARFQSEFLHRGWRRPSFFNSLHAFVSLGHQEAAYVFYPSISLSFKGRYNRRHFAYEILTLKIFWTNKAGVSKRDFTLFLTRGIKMPTVLGRVNCVRM